MFMDTSASVAMKAPVLTAGVPMTPAHPDWYPSTSDRPQVNHREPEPIKLQRRNRRSGGAGCMAISQKPQSPSNGGAVFSKEAIQA